MGSGEGSREQFNYPVDEGRHPEAGEEWWYFQSHLSSGDRRFAFIVCYLTSGLRMSGLADLDRGVHRRFVFGPESGPILTSEDRLSVSQGESNWEASNEGPPYRVHDLADGTVLDISLNPAKSPVPIAGGRVKMGRNGSSRWYAQTRLEVQGKIRIEGSQHSVEGTGWIDRQWGNWNRMGFGGWKWFSIQLGNGTDVATYLQYEPISRRRITSFCQIIEPDGSISLDRDLEIEDLGEWRSPKGAVYGSGWRITSPRLDLEMEVKPNIEDQEFYSGLWEGSCSVSGVLGSENVQGVAYTELNLGRPAPMLIKYLSYVKAVGLGSLGRIGGHRG